jgi:hypothetical protein
MHSTQSRLLRFSLLLEVTKDRRFGYHARLAEGNRLLSEPAARGSTSQAARTLRQTISRSFLF